MLFNADEIRKNCKKKQILKGYMTNTTYSVWENNEIIALIHDLDDDLIIVTEKATHKILYMDKKTTDYMKLINNYF